MYYNSKLLLFGEYTVIRGSRALAVPYSRYRGRWAYASGTKETAPLQKKLPALADHLAELNRRGELIFEFDIEAFRQELQKGLYFDSNIPVGYGLGSSGALCAALFDRFGVGAPDREDSPAYLRLKKALAQLEDFFHGSSSGIDPLICYLNRPVLIEAGGEIHIVSIPARLPAHLFLLNTGIPRQTGPLVNAFLEKCKDEKYSRRIDNELVPLVEASIDAFMNSNWDALSDSFHAVSHFQYRWFEEMIPEAFRRIWQEGLEGEDFHLKLCGAGGGGFLLGYAHDRPAAAGILRGYPVESIFNANE
jgi:mevalonate kinase